MDTPNAADAPIQDPASRDRAAPVWDASTPGFEGEGGPRRSIRRDPQPSPAAPESHQEARGKGIRVEPERTFDPGPAVPVESQSSEDRTWGALCHVAGLAGWAVPVPGAGVLGPLVIWLCRRDSSPYVDRQGRAAVNFQLLIALLYGLSMLLAIVLIGIPMMFAVGAAQFVLVLVGTIKAATGEGYRYPISIDIV